MNDRDMHAHHKALDVIVSAMARALANEALETAEQLGSVSYQLADTQEKLGSAQAGSAGLRAQFREQVEKTAHWLDDEDARFLRGRRDDALARLNEALAERQQLTAALEASRYDRDQARQQVEELKSDVLALEAEAVRHKNALLEARQEARNLQVALAGRGTPPERLVLSVLGSALSVAERLVLATLIERMPPGAETTAVSQRALARRLGMGRNRLREVLDSLADAGLAEVLPRRRIRVRHAGVASLPRHPERSEATGRLVAGPSPAGLAPPVHPPSPAAAGDV